MKRKDKNDKKIPWLHRQLGNLIAKAIYKRIKKYIDMKSWKTTLGGALGALGTYLATVHDPAWVAIVGQVLIGLGMFIVGATARDNNVSSEDAGAK